MHSVDPPDSKRIRWPEFMAGMDPSSRSFTFALGLSIVLHAVALSIHFKLPDIILDHYILTPLEVVLVNSKTRAKPVKADVLAQANLDGGGKESHLHYDARSDEAVYRTSQFAFGKGCWGIFPPVFLPLRRALRILVMLAASKRAG